ncbi:MAG: 1-acyl-sn-glycerol-3-phosphate acyltransferase [Myxococcota bacterium]|nr:1-acyl-sn-glycerol-3-phosphate acyltransferase [Myxococcota bacterium]
MASYALGYQTVRRDASVLERHTRLWAQGLVRGWGVRIEAHDVERIPSDRPCVLIANHQSHSDVPALFLALPTLPVFLAKRELRAVPVFGRVMETGGHVFIDRGKHQSAVDTIDAAARKLRAGSPLLVFPEGTRGRRAEIAAFKKGGFHLARKAGVAIVPIGIRGSRAVWPREARAALPGVITIHVGEPIPASEVSEGPIEALIERVRARVAELSELPLADL